MSAKARTRAARVFAVAGLVLLGTIPAKASARDKDSLLLRVEQARALVEQAGAQLDSLHGGLRRFSGERAAAPDYSPEDSAIWREVMAEKRRRAELDAAFDYLRSALGYTFNANLVLGMNAVTWRGDFGARFDGRVSLIESRRALGGNLSLLYAIREFYIANDGMYSRLYAFGGGGYYWQRRRIAEDVWYGTPDRVLRAQLGAGTELGLRELLGTRFVPEIGFQGERFVSRYQDSRNYSGAQPRTDYSLFPYYAFHVNFYFR